MKFGWKEYRKPTPKNVQKWAKSIRTICSSSAVVGIASQNYVLPIILLSISIIAEFAFDFCSENVN